MNQGRSITRRPHRAMWAAFMLIPSTSTTTNCCRWPERSHSVRLVSVN